MKRISTLCILFLSASIYCKSQDLLGGDIRSRHLSGFNYEATIDIYTRTSANVNRDTLLVSWGDASVDTLYSTEQVLGSDVSLYSFITTHTFTGQGTYTISIQDSFRVDSIQNIPNSINESLYVENTLVIDTLQGYNDSPNLSWLPVDNALKDQIYLYNPGATDPDGDSLAYYLLSPFATTSTIPSGMTIDSLTGDVTWNMPQDTGFYAVAVKIEEWRNGTVIGSATREMFIEVLPPSSIGETNDGGTVEIYPNPATGHFFIKGNFGLPAVLELFDVMGRQVLVREINSNHKEISVRELAEGAYVYKLKIKKEKELNGKVIVTGR